ncbi:glycoside hydrolase family 43 protein [Cadophora sp. DSE1049]|nr:glycoside hydrolase family 43 protein [Cadophora sp. DSE1049]
MTRIASILIAALPAVSAQAAIYGQCGGTGWTGATTCVSGSCCTFSNAWYSQCLPCTGGGASSASLTTKSVASTLATSTSTEATQQPSGSFTNPVVYEDFADNDVFLGPDGAYYFSASNMHYSPGAPILRSYDLVNWEFIGHSVPTLAFGDKYNMVGNTAYIGGTWASTLRYRKSTGLWYWIGCINFADSYVYTAPEANGPWTQASVISGTCFYDCGLFIDDDDKMYVVYGSSTVSMAQLSSNGLSLSKTQQIISTPSGYDFIEGNRMYKRDGIYYVLESAPGQQATLIWKSTSPWGPWTVKELYRDIAGPVAGGGTPHQGSLVETAAGAWYYMSFTWAYPAGRMPVLAPITWGSDGYPLLTSVNGAWGISYPAPLPSRPTLSWIGTDTFPGTSLSIPWEWNHNPDTSKYKVNNGLTLSTTTITSDLYKARNTLTHRVHGPLSVATIVININNMADGDKCGLAALRDQSAFIGISRAGSTYTISHVQGLLQDPDNSWATTSNGTTAASAVVAKGQIWLRGTMQAASSSAKGVTFSYSVDGTTFKALGGSYTLTTDWHFFMGYRWAIFNFATKALGGSVLVSSFTQA